MARAWEPWDGTRTSPRLLLSMLENASGSIPLLPFVLPATTTSSHLRVTTQSARYSLFCCISSHSSVLKFDLSHRTWRCRPVGSRTPRTSSTAGATSALSLCGKAAPLWLPPTSRAGVTTRRSSGAPRLASDVRFSSAAPATPCHSTAQSGPSSS